MSLSEFSFVFSFIFCLSPNWTCILHCEHLFSQEDAFSAAADDFQDLYFFYLNLKTSFSISNSFSLLEAKSSLLFICIYIRDILV
jgi:hypothetical protein